MHSIYDMLTFIQTYIHKNGVPMLIVMPNVKFNHIFKKKLKFENDLTSLPLCNWLNFCRLCCSNSKIPTVSGR